MEKTAAGGLAGTMAGDALSFVKTVMVKLASQNSYWIMLK
jgi:hypothetical protein